MIERNVIEYILATLRNIRQDLPQATKGLTMLMILL